MDSLQATTDGNSINNELEVEIKRQSFNRDWANMSEHKWEIFFTDLVKRYKARPDKDLAGPADGIVPIPYFEGLSKSKKFGKSTATCGLNEMISALEQSKVDMTKSYHEYEEVLEALQREGDAFWLIEEVMAAQQDVKDKVVQVGVDLLELKSCQQWMGGEQREGRSEALAEAEPKWGS